MVDVLSRRTSGLLAGFLLTALSLTSGCDPSSTPHSRAPIDNGFACVTYLVEEHPEDPTPALPTSLVDVRGPEGQARLRACTDCVNYPDIAAKFMSQVTQSFCGVASSAIVLNASDAGRPQRPVTAPYEPYPFYTQCNLFNPEAERGLPIEQVLHEGATLAQIRFLLEQQPTATGVACHHAGDADEGVVDHGGVADCQVASSREQFVAEARRALAYPGAHVIINFSRVALLHPDQNGHGHFSPLAAYHEPSDSFLVMDVARYKYPPFWATSTQLWDAMMAVDSSSGRARGYILVPPYEGT